MSQTFSPPKKIRLGSIYLSQPAHRALQELIDHHGHGPSVTIDVVLRQAAEQIGPRTPDGGST
jgi:hypothetical protein